MLVLTRKLKETICIGDNITITVVRVRPNSVRIGIDAPHDVRVVRGELAPKEPANKHELASRATRGEAIVIEHDEMGSCDDFSEEWLEASEHCLAPAP